MLKRKTEIKTPIHADVRENVCRSPTVEARSPSLQPRHCSTEPLWILTDEPNMQFKSILDPSHPVCRQVQQGNFIQQQQQQHNNNNNINNNRNTAHVECKRKVILSIIGAI